MGVINTRVRVPTSLTIYEREDVVGSGHIGTMIEGVLAQERACAR